MPRSAVRAVELELLGGAAQAAAAPLARARHARDAALGGRVAADDVVLGVGDEHVVVLIDGDVLGAVEERRGRGRRRRAKPFSPVPATVRIFPSVDHAQGVAVPLDDVDLALASTATARGSTRGACGRRRRPADALLAVARHGRDDARLESTARTRRLSRSKM